MGADEPFSYEEERSSVTIGSFSAEDELSSALGEPSSFADESFSCQNQSRSALFEPSPLSPNWKTSRNGDNLSPRNGRRFS
jgi:hypothetical protein